MPVVILAGIPAGVESRLRSYIKSHPTELAAAYKVAWFPSGGQRAGLSMARQEGLLRMANEIQASCVLIVSQKPTAESEQLRNSIQPYFRCRIIGARLLQGVYPSATGAVAELGGVLGEEQLWNKRIRPAAVDHPLILPERVFSAWPQFRDAWRAAAHAISATQIEDTAAYVESFALAHRARMEDGSGSYQSESDLMWDHRGERHGKAPFPRMWKYSFRVPDGFHYDVTHARSKGFEIRDAELFEHSVDAKGHLNIDPHGWCRTG